MDHHDRTPNADVSEGRHVTLTRYPELARRITEIYHWEDTEQGAIERCMKDMVRWADKGVLPNDLLGNADIRLSEDD